MEGRLHVYFGEGKGKTTCAMGLCARALGRGLAVCVFQFLKCGDTGEKRFFEGSGANIEFFCSGTRGFVFNMDGEEKREAVERESELLRRAAHALSSGAYGLVVLDEALGAVQTGVIGKAELLSALDARHAGTEAAVTGRELFGGIESRAGLITEMRLVKHYFNEGRDAKEGIEF